MLLRTLSGGGKTALAYVGVRHRSQVLTEDVVRIDPVRDHSWSVLRMFHQPPHASELFPELARYVPVTQTFGEMNLSRNPEEIRVGSTVYRAQTGLKS